MLEKKQKLRLLQKPNLGFSLQEESNGDWSLHIWEDHLFITSLINQIMNSEVDLVSLITSAPILYYLCLLYMRNLLALELIQEIFWINLKAIFGACFLSDKLS